MASQLVTLNVMLAIHCKKTQSIDLVRPLQSYIKKTFSESDAKDSEDDLAAVQAMRDEVERGSQNLEAKKEVLQKYFRALTVMESRFPISPDSKHVNSLTFTWFDAFKPTKKSYQQNVHFEKAAVLFNLGATLSQLALAADRSTGDGLKLACNIFQTAAGAFLYLKENVSLKASVGGGASLDISQECAGMLERLMLGQAQECFYEKAVADGKSASLCAKIAQQVAMFYEEAHAALLLPPLAAHFERPWVANVQAKSAQFLAEALVRRAAELRKDEDLVEDITEEIARLQAAKSILADARKNGKGVMQPIMDSILRLEGQVLRGLKRAEEENDKVYLMRVPPPSAFPPIAPTTLVRATNVSDVLDATHEGLFAGIIPDSSTKELSKYTDMVDSLIRTQAEKLQQESELAKVQLKEMGLPDLLLAWENDVSVFISSKLREDVEAVIVSGGISSLHGALAQLRDLRRVNEERLVETEAVLEGEAKEDSSIRAQFGARWTRPASITLSKFLRERASTFAKNLKQARENDGKIEKAVKESEELLAVLQCERVEDAIPRMSRPIVSVHGDDSAIASQLKHLLAELQRVGSERAALEDLLKETKQKENLLPQVMNSGGSVEALFRRELAKYDPITADVQRNISAQQQLLQDIKVQNGIFWSTFNIPEYKASVDGTLKHLEAAIGKYQELRANINEGLKFYVALQDAIDALKQQCSDFAMTRSIQCQEMVDDLQRQLSGLTFSSPAPPQSMPSPTPLHQQPQPYPHAPPASQPSAKAGGGGSRLGFISSLPFFQQPQRPPPPASHPPSASPQESAPAPPPHVYAPSQGNTQPGGPSPGQYYQPGPPPAHAAAPEQPYYYPPQTMQPHQQQQTGFYAPPPSVYGTPAGTPAPAPWPTTAPQGYAQGPPPQTSGAPGSAPHGSSGYPNQPHYQFPPGYQ